MKRIPYDNPVTAFFVLVFCLSWAFWIPMVFIGDENTLLRIAGTFCPAAAALFLSGITCGTKGLKELLGQFRLWKAGVFWYAFCLLSTAVLVLTAIALYSAISGIKLDFNDPGNIYLVIPAFLYVLFFSVLGEEAGWRGFALPRLQKQFGPLPASIIIGMLWGLWHLPLFWIPGNFHAEIPLVLFIFQDIALSVVITWIYNKTGGSLPLVHIFHAASNTTLGVLPVLPMDTAGDLRPMYVSCALLGLLALWIVLSGKLKPQVVA